MILPLSRYIQVGVGLSTSWHKYTAIHLDVGRREPKANPGVIGMVDSYLVQVQAWALKGGNV